MAIALGTRPPPGLLRRLARLPLQLYRAGLGRLLDHWFVEITHTGRKSGLPRRTVLEVLRYDRATRTCVIVSRWGDESDWVRNLRKTPAVQVNLGGTRWPAVATFLGPDAAERELRAYARHRRLLNGVVTRLLGNLPVNRGVSLRDQAQRMAVVVLRPARAK
jgi:deazaflavin-dependent oxidoreductase (nitroreductase family)